MKYQNDIKTPEITMAAPEDRRHLYGVLLSLSEFRQAYHHQIGYCRGCKAANPSTDHQAKGLKCDTCGRPRVFGAVQYVWNGWIDTLPQGRDRRRSIERLLDQGFSSDLPPALAPVSED